VLTDWAPWWVPSPSPKSGPGCPDDDAIVREVPNSWRGREAAGPEGRASRMAGKGIAPLEEPILSFFRTPAGAVSRIGMCISPDPPPSIGNRRRVRGQSPCQRWTGRHQWDRQCVCGAVALAEGIGDHRRGARVTSLPWTIEREPPCGAGARPLVADEGRLRWRCISSGPRVIILMLQGQCRRNNTGACPMDRRDA
jgi:hypothetical protein